MWELVATLITLGVGFFCGVLVGDTASTNMQINELQKKVRRLENELRKQN